jgi:hypothetical protein
MPSLCFKWMMQIYPNKCNLVHQVKVNLLSIKCPTLYVWFMCHSNQSIIYVIAHLKKKKKKRGGCLIMWYLYFDNSGQAKPNTQSYCCSWLLRPALCKKKIGKLKLKLYFYFNVFCVYSWWVVQWSAVLQKIMVELRSLSIVNHMKIKAFVTNAKKKDI